MMLRKLHSVAALAATFFVCFMAISGTILAFGPASDAWQASSLPAGEISTAEAVGKVLAHDPTAERIVHTANGQLIVYSKTAAGKTAKITDPETGLPAATYAPSAFLGFVTELHRSLFMGTAGHAIAGLSALAMAFLSITGTIMLAERVGGWRRLLSPLQGRGWSRLHAVAGRLALLGLPLTALTGVYMSLVSFGMIDDGQGGFSAFPDKVNGGQPAQVETLAALQTIPLADLRELTFPAKGDPTDVFSITTRAGQGYVDQATGEMLNFTPNSLAQSIYEFIYMLHTGQGLWWLGVALGAAAMTVPPLALSGLYIWWQRQRGKVRIAHNVGAQAADTIILTGSQGNSTCGFARALHDELTKAGYKVHTAAMSELEAGYRSARRMFILTSTYGDGAAPESAKGFLSRLAAITTPPAFRFAVLGFGDSQFKHFCQFAHDTETALLKADWKPFMPLHTIDRQSSQAFAAWGNVLGGAIGKSLRLEHVPTLPSTRRLVLVGREDHGRDVQAPVSILRFAAAGTSRSGRLARLFNRLPRFEAGDLVGIVPPGESVPRYYSLASSSRDGFLEICVRKHRGGVCSQFLHGMEPGDVLEGFIQPNPDFRPAAGKAPVIMIAAGTGIAPFAGFIRRNSNGRALHLYWGGRDPRSDFLYARLLKDSLDNARLTRLVPAFSRIAGGDYVQDKVRLDAANIRRLVQQGGQIAVCGGKDMARGVMHAVEEVLAPLGQSVATLKAERRYIEDVY